MSKVVGGYHSGYGRIARQAVAEGAGASLFAPDTIILGYPAYPQ